MKKIPLTQNKLATIDDEKYLKLSKYKWHAEKKGKNWYVCRSKRRGLDKETIFMHREILGLKRYDGKQTDHRNGNGLDNRLCNLRICNSSQNKQNQPKTKGFSSKYKGVTWCKNRKKWQAQIKYKQKTHFLGRFKSEVKAARAYDKKAKELFGGFAYLNFPERENKRRTGQTRI